MPSKLYQKPQTVTVPVRAPDPRSPWQKAVDYLGISAEVSNVGVVIESLARVQGLGAILTVAGGAFAYLAFITNPLIYFFRSLIRITQVIGREFFGVKFGAEKKKKQRRQTAADLLSLSLFSLSIPFFLGAILAPPIGITVAWGIALAGLCVNCYFDYHLQAKAAEEQWKVSCAEKGVNHADSLRAHQDFINKQNSTRLFIALLIGSAFLVICGSAAVFAPPLLVPLLLIASKLGSLFLGTVACLRFFNWLRSGIGKKDEKALENANTVSPGLTSAPQSTTTLTKALLAEKASTASQEVMTDTVVVNVGHQHQLFSSTVSHSNNAGAVDDRAPATTAYFSPAQTV